MNQLPAARCRDMANALLISPLFGFLGRVPLILLVLVCVSCSTWPEQTASDGDQEVIASKER